MVIDLLKNEILKIKAWKEIQELKDRRGFLKAGLPRFDRLFGRDSLISAWQLLNKSPGICQATLEVLCQYQGKTINDDREEEPGKILHETDFEKAHRPPEYFPFPYYGSVDSTPLFLILFGFYYKKTKDLKFLNSHWENILKAAKWMEEYGDKDRDFFLEYQRKNPRGLFHQGWKDGFKNHLKIEPPVALSEVQGYQYRALKETANLASVKGDLDLKKRMEDRSRILKEKFNRKFWMEKEGYFALALDGKKEQKQTITSNPGHLLFTGILDEEKIEPVIEKLFSRELFTPFGIRNHSRDDADFDPRSNHSGTVWPHENWVIAQGLKKLGRKKEYKKIKNALLAAQAKIGFLPEFYGVIKEEIITDTSKKACYPQAWASGALFNFLSEFDRTPFRIPRPSFRW